MSDFKPRTIRIVGRQQVDTAVNAIRSLPTGAGLEVVIRQEQNGRKLDQNAAYWAGPLRDIAEQAWIGGRQYSAEILHEHFKAEFLPEEDDPELEALVKSPEAWRKWDFKPNGERICIGSTTGLTIKGFARYMQQVEAFGAQLGVMFHENPHREAA